jgi:hypothetical protein
MEKPTVKDRIVQALSESPWCLNAHDIGQKIDVDPNLVTPNLTQMLRESPPRIERHVLARKYVYLLKVDPA